jgi:hypothetical protein
MDIGSEFLKGAPLWSPFGSTVDFATNILVLEFHLSKKMFSIFGRFSYV